jgi:transposase
MTPPSSKRLFESGSQADKRKERKKEKLKNGEEEMSHRKAYPSDLTDAEWEILESLIPAISPDAVRVEHSRREIVNGILYVLRSGCPWRLLPHDFPVWGTVYSYFRVWRNQGIWDQVLESLRQQMRKQQGREEEPSAAVIDSQSIKTSAVRGPEKGFDMGKKNLGAQKTRGSRYPGQSHGRQGHRCQSFRSRRRQDGACDV